MNDNYLLGRKNSGHLDSVFLERKEGKKDRRKGKGKIVKPGRSIKEINWENDIQKNGNLVLIKAKGNIEDGKISDQLRADPFINQDFVKVTSPKNSIWTRTHKKGAIICDHTGVFLITEGKIKQPNPCRIELCLPDKRNQGLKHQ